MSLPPPVADQAFCNVSPLEAGIIGLPLKIFIPTTSNDILYAPSLSFLIQHTKKSNKLLFDLGIRKDWHNYPPCAAVIDEQRNFPLEVRQDVVESLEKGGLTPSDIDIVCLSHCHFDHVGDTKLFPTSRFLVGAAAASLFNPGYPSDPSSSYESDLLPPERTTFLETKEWAPLGPFPRALDFYGDGSVYIVDAVGHCPGHINLLVRTSSDGGWLFLAGDSGHHWFLVTGECRIPTAHGCAHVNKDAAEEHLARMRDLLKNPRVRILLAHDEPWYRDNKDGPAFWPGKLDTA